MLLLFSDPSTVEPSIPHSNHAREWESVLPQG
jgi:hypothetical protein